MSKCPTLSCLSISDKGHPPYCSVSSSLNSGMFPLNCPYRNKYIFGEIAEVSHVNRFSTQADTFLPFVLFQFLRRTHPYLFFKVCLATQPFLVIRLKDSTSRTCFTLHVVLLRVQQPFISSYETRYSIWCKLFYLVLPFPLGTVLA